MKFPSFLYCSILNLLDKYCSDKAYLSWMFYHRLGYWPNLKSPKSFNEKIQWLKLYYRNPLYTTCADKYLVRQYIENLIGGQYLIPLINVYDNASEIDFDRLPERFVLKCNHGAGCNLICRDKATFDRTIAIAKLNQWMDIDYSRLKREWHYQNIKRKIVCEQYMEDKEHSDLLDYKFFCIGGKVEMIQVDFERSSSHKRNLYNVNWELLDVEISFPHSEEVIEKPQQLPKMVELAEVISNGFPQLRVDFYLINGIIYFGEMTFFSGAGFSKYTPVEFDYKLGSLVELPQKNYNND